MQQMSAKQAAKQTVRDAEPRVKLGYTLDANFDGVEIPLGEVEWANDIEATQYE